MYNKLVLTMMRLCPGGWRGKGDGIASLRGILREHGRRATGAVPAAGFVVSDSGRSLGKGA